MAVSYADALSPYHKKGIVGLIEVADEASELQRKVEMLAELVASSECCVLHTGAGISTAAGIPDFRGPRGVWTLEARNERSTEGVSFVEASPTYTHYAINALESKNIVKFVITQNVDGLHVRSGYPLNRIAELHGNVFLERCGKCGRRYYRTVPVESIGLKVTGRRCEGTNSGRPCRGVLHDVCLDWEDPLPEEDFAAATNFARNADLSICLGTTLQITPAGDLPLLAKKNGGKMVIINLSKTKYDRKADLIIKGPVDDVMKMLMTEMGIPVVQKCNSDFVNPYSRYPLERFIKRRKRQKVKQKEQEEKKDC